jgi:hypothetical protein
MGAVKTAREGGNKSSVSRLKENKTSDQEKEKKRRCSYACARAVTWVNFVLAATILQLAVCTSSMLQGGSKKMKRICSSCGMDKSRCWFMRDFFPFLFPYFFSFQINLTVHYVLSKFFFLLKLLLPKHYSVYLRYIIC